MAVATTLRKMLHAGPLVAVQRVIPEDAVNLMRCKLFPMHEREVTRVLEGLLDEGVQFVLAGGWGVDALIPELRRRHSDLDIIVVPVDLPAFARTIAAAGYEQTPEVLTGGWWAPDMTVYRNASRGRIEVLLLTPQQLQRLAARAEALLGRAVDRAPARGWVAGVEVPCLSAELQLAAHEGFEMNRDQREDLRAIEALARR